MLSDLVQGLILIIVSLALTSVGAILATDFHQIVTSFQMWQEARIQRRLRFLRGRPETRTVGAYRAVGVLMALMGVLAACVVVANLPAHWLAGMGLALFYVTFALCVASAPSSRVIGELLVRWSRALQESSQKSGGKRGDED